jgi:hypothetical protein
MNLPSESNSTKRRIIYVDDRIQMWLLVALVTLEVLLITGTLWMLYIQMSEVLEANLYRIHFSQKQSIYPLLLKTILIGLVGLITVNALMLWLISWAWTRHVDSILNPFRNLVSKVEALDFREDEPMKIPHKVVELTLAWRYSNRQQMLILRQAISQLNEFKGSPDTQAVMKSKLETIKELCQKIN